MEFIQVDDGLYLRKDLIFAVYKAKYSEENKHYVYIASEAGNKYRVAVSNERQADALIDEIIGVD